MRETPASPLDLFQRYLGEKERTFQLCIAAKLAGRIDEDRLRTAADLTASELPILSSRFTGGKESGSFARGTEPVPVIVTDQTPDQMMMTLYPETDALFRIIVCRGRRFDTLIFSAAHLLTDARGLLEVAGRIADLYRAPETFAKEIIPQKTDRTLDLIREKFSAEEVQELFAREEERMKETAEYKKYFCGTKKNSRIIFLRASLGSETLARMKTFAKSLGGTMHDLLVAAYASALCEYLEETAGQRPEKIPLCSTVDLRRYISEEERTPLANYTVAYWSPILCDNDFSKTVSSAVELSQNLKEYFIGVGAANPFFEAKPSPHDTEMFAGMPFLTNPGVVPDDALNFGEDVIVEEMEALGVTAGGLPLSVGVLTFRDVMHLFLCEGEKTAEDAQRILLRTVEILKSVEKNQA